LFEKGAKKLDQTGPEGTKDMAKFFGKFSSKASVPIGYNLFGNAVMGKDMSAIQFGYFHSIYFLIIGEEDCHFGAVMIGDGENSVIPSTRWQFSDEIKGYGLERGCSWFWNNWIQRRL
jgi:hypothetical protein